MPGRVKIMVYNTQDFFLHLAHEPRVAELAELSEAQWQLLATGSQPIKPKAKLEAIAQMLKDEAPDVIALCEIGGRLSLERFNRLFLGNRYHVFLNEAYSDRGIDTGFLLAKSSGWLAELETHKDWPLAFQYAHEQDPSAYPLAAAAAAYLDLGLPDDRRLSRDIAALHLRKPSCPSFSLLMCHLKSGLDVNGIDPGGQVRRAAELKALLSIYKRVGEQRKNPVLLAGDFNGNASREGTAKEFEPLYAETDLEDALYLAGRSKHERLTHFTYTRGQIETQQFDYLFVPKAFAPHLCKDKTQVYRYRFQDDRQEIELPFSFRDRNLLPSDHYPLVAEFAF